MTNTAGATEADARKAAVKHDESAGSLLGGQVALEPKIGCIASALRVLGQKWTALIIRDLYSGPKRFGELEKSVGTINPRTLSQRLEALETHGVVTKKTYAEVPPRTKTPPKHLLPPIFPVSKEPPWKQGCGTSMLTLWLLLFRET